MYGGSWYTWKRAEIDCLLSVWSALQKYEDARKAFKAVLDNYPHSDFKDDAQHLIAQSYLVEVDRHSWLPERAF